jgi:hypothetical protein
LNAQAILPIDSGSLSEGAGLIGEVETMLVNVQPPPPLRRFLDPLTLAVFNNEEPRDETHTPRPPAH